jgi:hypothetical protein
MTLDEEIELRATLDRVLAENEMLNEMSTLMWDCLARIVLCETNDPGIDALETIRGCKMFCPTETD